MTETILGILLKGTEIFTDERRRYFSKKLLEHHQKVNDLENARHPDYNDDKIALAKEERDAFLVSYKTEFDNRLNTILSQAVPSE